MSGRLVACSAAGFGEAFPHHLLAAPLPHDPVRIGEAWEDRGLARALDDIIPARHTLNVEGTATLMDVQPARTGWRLRIDEHTRVAIGGVGPLLVADGRRVWDTDPGCLHARAVHVRMQASTPTAGHAGPGTLSAYIQRIPHADAPLTPPPAD